MRIANIAGITAAAMIGFATLTAAQAAPFSAASPSVVPVERGIAEVGGKHRAGHRHRHRGHRHGRRWRHGHYVRHRRGPVFCVYKRIKVYDPFYDEYYFKRRKVCTRY